MFSDLIFAYDAMMNAANLSSKVTSNLFTVRSDKSALNTKLSFKTLDELSVMNKNAFSDILNVYAIYLLASMEEKDATALLLSEHLFEDLEQVFKNELNIYACKLVKEKKLQDKAKKELKDNVDNKNDIVFSKSNESFINLISMLDECLIDDVPVDFLHDLWESVIKSYGFNKEEFEFLLTQFHVSSLPQKDMFLMDADFVKKYFEVQNKIPLIFKKRDSDVFFYRDAAEFRESFSSDSDSSKTPKKAEKLVFKNYFVATEDENSDDNGDFKKQPSKNTKNAKKTDKKKTDNNKEISKNLPINPLDKER